MSDSAEKQQGNSTKVVGRPFKKGVSGNPNGRPKKGTAIADILNARGDEVDDNGLTNREIMLHKVYDKAVKHTDRWAVQFIADRTEGRAIERSVVSDEWKELVTELHKPES
tara:strand:+ start:1591 stop:1923 length:333 start_codon:yes stop_codon:yes gene_type:complete